MTTARTPRNDPIHDVARHVVDTRLQDIPPDAVSAARTFILDTLGVGISGSSGPRAAELSDALAGMGYGREARVWSTGRPMPAWAAAQCNAYQTHCQEFDCVHEEAVAHVMTIVLPAALAGAERAGGIPGSRLIEAVVLGVDVAASIGAASTAGLTFFRPATVGALGGVAAIGKVLGFDQRRLVEAFSLAYGQICGTMQAHTEGSLLLAMQMGFNARNAVTACDLALAGFTGPHGLLAGDFGFYRLFEEGGDPDAVVQMLGKRWRITEIAHKPFPSGRATHGILDGCLGLQNEHGFEAEQVCAVRLTVPPLIDHLVGRPPATEMAINYARLCARYVLSSALYGKGLALSDFNPGAYRREDRQALAANISIGVRDDGDPNALAPIGIEIDLADGAVLTRRVDDVYGSPANPMTRNAQLAKFRANCSDAAMPLTSDRIEDLVGLIEKLTDVADVTVLVDLMTP
ncbi:MAG: MmgE/PrpD family protein [Pseudomonadota bacterium]